MDCRYFPSSPVLIFAASLAGLASPIYGQATTNGFAFADFLLAPIRIHLLSAANSPAIQTTLDERDIDRILKKINGVWAQAGLRFYPEAIVREEAHQPEFYPEHGQVVGRSLLLGLRPEGSQVAGAFHIYYLKKMSMNGIYFPEAIFVKDTASLRKVEGGIDEPLPRVTSHELGHALSLPHRQDTTNLMASGTTGTWLNETEISQAREVARQFAWFEPATKVMEKAETLFRAHKLKEAALLYSRLATIPLKSDQVELAKQRAAIINQTHSK